MKKSLFECQLFNENNYYKLITKIRINYSNKFEDCKLVYYLQKTHEEENLIT